ncbi:uncharacterized protein BXZ73DRAFT_106462 [Epithele typhae]|uniref:uncharacterized protein n=1 Tax=Epithele typhae TaxID=378194 RepID=UPI0020072D37|nr:uncharacterized protein BXZ73DRAFT_106462 [Epithele typhae]KAH9914791.1 hypothetical protein BXZ73DRAFT_106462 [Epithele typhae]
MDSVSASDSLTYAFRGFKRGRLQGLHSPHWLRPWPRADTASTECGIAAVLFRLLNVHSTTRVANGLWLDIIIIIITRVQAGVLRAHRTALTYLEFRDHTEMGLRDAEDEDGASGSVSPASAPHLALLHLCPRLRHLVFEGRKNDVESDADRLPPHPTPAFVDVWVSTCKMTISRSHRCQTRPNLRLR